MKISVVIPNYNGKALLAKHLPTVLMSLDGYDGEIIVVDDASVDNSVDLLKKEFPKVKIEIHKKNKRFVAACNSGVKRASGEIVVILNNDVSTHKDFLRPLITHFKNKKVFAVGCKEYEKIDGKKIESGRGMGKFRRGFLVHWRALDQNKTTTLWASGGSMAVRKSIWNELGGMDTMFKPAYEEDRDISYRAMKRGYLVRFESKAKVYHKHESTNTRELGRSIMRISSYKNQILFVWKNITDLNLFIKHILWLPYHLLLTTLRSKGLFLFGFLWAVCQLPQVYKRRLIEKRESIYTDKIVLKLFQ